MEPAPATALFKEWSGYLKPEDISQLQAAYHFSEAALLEVLAQASLDAKRTLRVLERRTQSQDHPILLTVPETLYLKCLVLEVV